jgi:valyl-tRNA synthetase
MLGIYTTGKVPFKDVYLHGLVLDEKGQKMSKSKGNVINPMEMVAEHGSDALRLGLVAARSAGQNQAFSASKVVAGRNFCNKLWNIARFVQDRIGDHYTPGGELTPQTPADHWIIRELNQASVDIASHLENYRFAEASEVVYHTVWDSVADWYVEVSKKQNNDPLLAWVLDTCLKLAHPFAPFVTETIWQTLNWHDNLLISASWPNTNSYDDIAAAEFERLQKLVIEARYVMSELPGNKRYGLLYQNDSLIADNLDIIQHLAKLSSVTEVDQARGLRLAASNREAWLDIDAETLYEHQHNLEQRLVETRQFVSTLEARLGNEGYVAKAPAALVEESRQQLEIKKTLIQRLEDELTVLT